MPAVISSSCDAAEITAGGRLDSRGWKDEISICAVIIAIVYIVWNVTTMAHKVRLQYVQLANASWTIRDKIIRYFSIDVRIYLNSQRFILSELYREFLSDINLIT